MRGSGHGMLAQGPMSGDPAAAGLGLVLSRPQCRGGGAGRRLRLALRRRRAAGGQRRRCAKGRAAGPARHLAARGSTPGLSSTACPGPRAARSAPVPRPCRRVTFHLGAGPGDPATGGWQGLIDEVRLRAEALPAAWIALEADQPPRALGELRPWRRGRGGRRARGPGGPADRGQGDGGRACRPRPAGLGPRPGRPRPGARRASTSRRAAAPRSSTAGSATRPRAGFIGRDRFAYTVSGGGKRSTGLITVEVAPPTIAGGRRHRLDRGRPARRDRRAGERSGPGPRASLGVEAPAHGTATISRRRASPTGPSPGSPAPTASPTGSATLWARAGPRSR